MTKMRLGIGGRAFGVRGGISNRGFGVGVGPVSVGSSWRRRRRRRGGGWSGLIPILLVVGWLSSLCSHPAHPMQPTQIGPPLAPVTTTPTPTPPYQPESDVDRFLRHAHALGIQHHQGDGALVATGMRICDAVRKGTPVPSVVLGFTEVFVVQGGVNQKDADAFAWYAIDDLCGDALPPGGYCVEGGFWNGATQECMSDHPTQSPPGATVTLPTSSVTPTPPYGDCANGDDCHGGTYTPPPTRSGLI
jgi:hypothetical protein